MIALLWTYRKWIGLGLLFVGITIIYVSHRDALIQQGKDIELAICNAGKLETINGNLQIQEKSNDIKRPDIDGIVDRLREGKY